MMCATALCVNKALFGSRPGARATETTQLQTDTITPGADGGVVIHSGALTDIDGYAGPVPLDIMVADGRIAAIEPLENAETPSFFSRAAALFYEWIGKTPEEALAERPDAVSGATYTSVALTTNVEAAMQYYLSSEHAAKSAPVPWKLWVALGVTLAACVVPLFVRNRIYNYVQQVANVAVLGFWCGQFLDYSLMLKYLSGGIALPAGLTAIAMLVAAFLFPLFGRPQHYCNHICPLGAAQMLAAEICGYKIRIGARTLRILDWVRKILWAVLMLLLWADVWTGWMDLELFQAFMYESAPVGIIIAACAFVGLSAVVARPYCRFVCPTGSLMKRAENLG